MIGQHTKGIIRVNFDGHIINYVGEPYCSLVIDNVSSQLVPVPIAKEVRMSNARRLAACWNAFEGVRTEMVEAIIGTGAMQVACESMSNLPAAQSELAAARALLTEALASDDEAIADAEVVGLSFPAELTALTERIRAFLKGQP